MASFTIEDFSKHSPFYCHYQGGLFWMPMGLGGNNNVVNQGTEDASVGVKALVPGSTSSDPTKCWIPGFGMTLYVLMGATWTGTILIEGWDQFGGITSEIVSIVADVRARTTRVYAAVSNVQVLTSDGSPTLQVSTRTSATSGEEASHGLPFRLRRSSDLVGAYISHQSPTILVGATYDPLNASVRLADGALTAAGQLGYFMILPGAILTL